MSDTNDREQQQLRKRRLSAELRENLRRRKAQAKARAGATSSPPGASHDSAGFPSENDDEKR